MSSISKWYLRLIASLFLHVVLSELKQGDPCIIQANGAKGTCKLLTNCTSLITLLHSNEQVFPQKCSVEDSKFIICCQNDDKNTTVSRPMGETKSGFPSIDGPPGIVHSISVNENDKSTDDTSSRKTGAISAQKCIEYAELAWEVKEQETLSIIKKTTRILECAFEKIPLVKGGTKASRFEFPHMAALGYQTDSKHEILWKCGGTLISNRYVLTAAHCLTSRDFGSVKHVRLGVNRLTDKRAQDVDVMEVIPHPLYRNDRYHDIGLLKLAKDVEMTPYVRPACLYAINDIPFEKAIATGFGQINDTVEFSKDLLKVVLEFFNNNECNNTYRSLIKTPGSPLQNGIIEDLMLCAGSRTEEKDTCKGDSGGPLQIYHEETETVRCMYDVVGITSFGQGCGLSLSHPGVYTRVSHYIKWIEDIVWPENIDTKIL